MPREIGLARHGPLVIRHARRTAHQRDAPAGKRVLRPSRLRHQQARARIGLEVLRVHGHAADEEKRRAVLIRRIGHDRAEGMARVPARERRERARAREMDEGPRTLGVARFGRGRRPGVRAGGAGVAIHVRCLDAGERAIPALTYLVE